MAQAPNPYKAETGGYPEGGRYSQEALDIHRCVHRLSAITRFTNMKTFVEASVFLPSPILAKNLECVCVPLHPTNCLQLSLVLSISLCAHCS